MNYSSLIYPSIFIGMNIFRILVFLYLAQKKTSNEIRSIQNIHYGKNISRLGGLCFYLSILPIAVLLGNNQLFLFLMAVLPIIVVTTLEDIFQIMPPIIRLISIFISSIIVCYLFFDKFPILDIPYLGNLINNSLIVQIIFYSLAITIISNGFNLIDGLNGLATSCFMSSTLSVMFLALFLTDHSINFINLPYFEHHLIKYSILFSVIFLLFNFPFGKIFLGDTGAYFLGFILSFLVIKFYALNPQISTWSAILFIIYPFTEVIFSFFRKVFQKKSPFQPDAYHIHLIVYRVFSYGLKNRKLFSNSVSTIFLSFFIFYPMLSIFGILFNSLYMIFFSILFFLILYIILYSALVYLDNDLS